jgi:hypothetical protein
MYARTNEVSALCWNVELNSVPTILTFQPIRAQFARHVRTLAVGFDGPQLWLLTDGFLTRIPRVAPLTPPQWVLRGTCKGSGTTETGFGYFRFPLSILTPQILNIHSPSICGSAKCFIEHVLKSLYVLFSLHDNMCHNHITVEGQCNA